jgi:leucyl aminopeptidase
MKITCKSAAARLTKTELLVVFGKEGARVKLPAGVRVPGIAVETFGGKELETRLTDATGGPAKRVLLIGLGKGEPETEVVRRAAAIAVRKAGKIGVSSAVLWTGAVFGGKAGGFGQALAEGAMMGAYQLTEFLREAPAVLQRLAMKISFAMPSQPSTKSAAMPKVT